MNRLAWMMAAYLSSLHGTAFAQTPSTSPPQEPLTFKVKWRRRCRSISTSSACRARSRAATRTIASARWRQLLGSGIAPGYAVVNLDARYQAARRIEVLAQINNLFDRHYDTTAQLGPAGFSAAGTFQARPFPAVNTDFPVQQATFFTPGAPFTFWVGTRLKF